jgi:RimJ/RimL family protein N-acetyltransferase
LVEQTPRFTGQVLLREVTEDDLPVFFEQQLDPEAYHMAAFTDRDPADRGAFIAHWDRLLADDAIIKRTILVDGTVAGNVLSFPSKGKREVGYWIGREFWGRGVATSALSQFLAVVTTRPLYASAAADNAASIRVLEKCGFRVIYRSRDFAQARGEEIEEVNLELR